MIAFVTGATGFLGQHLVQQLLANGWKVTALCRSPQKAANLGLEHVNWQTGSLTDIDSLRRAMPYKPDAVFHLAGDTSTWALNNKRQYKTNVTGSANLAQVALEKQTSRFIHTSSIAIYGFHDERIDENSEKRGADCPVPYCRTKYLGEEAVRERIKDGLDAVFLNPTAIIGPYDEHNWVQFFDLIQQQKLPGVPPGSVTCCFAPEVASAHLNAFVHGRTGENYLLGGPDARLIEIAHWIGQRLDKPVPERALPGWLLKTLGHASSAFSYFTRKEPSVTIEKADLVCADVLGCSDKAVRELHYKADIPLAEMLEATYQWWAVQADNKQPVAPSAT